jgi:two-component system phosphate regulon sensor histidine kinase PhoR
MMNLTESELFQHLLEQASSPTLLIGLPSGVILGANSSARQQFLLSSSAQSSFLDLVDIPPASPLWPIFSKDPVPAPVSDTLFLAVDEYRQRPVEVELTSLRHDGDHYAVATCRFPYSDVGAERADENDLFLSLFDQSPLPLVFATIEGVHVRANQAFAELSGFSAEEVVGRSNLSLNLWYDLEERELARRLLNEHGKIENMEAVLRKKDGSTMTCLLSTRIVEAAGQRRVINAIQDISTLMAAKQALRNSEMLFRDFFRTNPVATIITSPSGEIHMANPAFVRDSGYEENEIIGHTSQELGFWRNPQDREQMVEAIKTQGFIDNLETSFYGKGGQPMTCIVSSRAIDYQDETRILSIVCDVTEQKKAEEAMKRLAQAKSDFISIAAHELRTPLIAVIGYAELLEGIGQGGLPEDQLQEYLTIIRTNAEVLNRLVDDLLDVGRIQLGRPLGVTPVETSLAELIVTVVESFKLEHGQHQFVIDHSTPLPETLWIDGERIMQVLNNLLGNAVKYSPDGGMVTIRTITGPKSVSVTIEDHGVGMQPEEIERVFDKFYRVDVPIPLTTGLGLGMSIVKQIIDDHGGEITISSVHGEGTTVTFALPITGRGSQQALCC